MIKVGLDMSLSQAVESGINWNGCALVERVPGKVSGKPIVRGTRILADTIVEDAELGSTPQEILENYPDLSISTIHELIAFASLARGGATGEGSTRPQSSSQAADQPRQKRRIRKT